MTHWAIQYIGLPWKYGAQGPTEFDCWGFVRHVEREHFGVDVPLIDYDDDWHVAARHLKEHPERVNWERMERPREGDLVMMARGRLPIHIGVYITANGKPGILHCLQGAGVVFNEMKSLRSAGWGALQYYRRSEACTT